MAIVKKCLNDACTQYIYLDDGRVIRQPQNKCDIKHVNTDFIEEANKYNRDVRETITVDKHMFKDAKEGKKLEI